ncbi:MAG: hypothetical protein IT203_06150, partial [Fimbriimonadaceae bacterium]|nr:hypothetical protein [Fimbriimonadaceae bacterium]
MRKFGWLIAVVLTTGMAFAQAPASDLVTQARQTAAKSGKVPFIRFTASWCGWCHK